MAIMNKNKLENEDQAWLDFKARFADIYDESNYARPLQSALMRASHRLVERGFQERCHFSKVLEIGAGTGEHIDFVRHTFDQYVLSDIDAKTLIVAERKLNHRFANRLMYETQSAVDLSYADNSFDRLIATHILEHIYQPHLALKEWRRVLKHGGVLSILIPTDPGLAWRLGRHLGPRKNAIVQGIAYDYVMAREHVNSCNNLIAILRHYFPEAKEAWWPLSVSSIDLNLFFAFHAIVSKEGVS
jgi:ubiquinone/menaquinone biosynthesis C-methylase UbiE